MSYEVVNENGEQFGGPHETFEEAREDREDCDDLYDGHFYVEETEGSNDAETKEEL